MTLRMWESIFSWRSIVGAAAPPRNPNDDEHEGDEENGGDEDDDREPAVIREPDEDWSRRTSRYSVHLTGEPLRRGDDRMI
jgi:hypothetical protein